MSFSFLSGKGCRKLGHPSLPGHPSREEPVPPRPPGQKIWLAVTVAALIAVAALSMVLFLPRYLLSWDLAGSTVRPADGSCAYLVPRGHGKPGTLPVDLCCGSSATLKCSEPFRGGRGASDHTAELKFQYLLVRVAWW